MTKAAVRDHTADNMVDRKVGVVPDVAISHLTLTRFRSYAQTSVDLRDSPQANGKPPAAIVLTGPNGAGKTNVLEALSFLAPGRGLRRASLPDVEHRPPGPRDPAIAKGWAVAARLYNCPPSAGDMAIGVHDEIQIGTGREPGTVDGSDRRIVRINGAAARTQTALADHLHVTWLTPDMDGLFTGPAGDRRRFFDRLVYGFVPNHAGHLAAYEKHMRERNRLLKQHRQGGTLDAVWLDTLEHGMAEAGVAMAAARRDVLHLLVTALAEEEGAAFPIPGLAIDGEIETLLGEQQAALATEDHFREKLAHSRRQDADAGRTLTGPHRSDLMVTFQPKAMPAAQCSTGEQKALLIALVLAAARLRRAVRGSAPLLLLDEVAAHLDEGRRRALFDTVLALGGQAWMTGTDTSLFQSLQGRATYLHVRDGHLANPDDHDRA